WSPFGHARLPCSGPSSPAAKCVWLCGRFRSGADVTLGKTTFDCGCFRLEPIRFPIAASAIRELRKQFEQMREAQRAADLDLLARARSLIDRSRLLLEASAPVAAAAAIAEVPSAAASPQEFATEVPYFDPPALRELASRARRFAETLSPSYRGVVL